jgi:hypothetical protein
MLTVTFYCFCFNGSQRFSQPAGWGHSLLAVIPPGKFFGYTRRIAAALDENVAVRALTNMQVHDTCTSYTSTLMQCEQSVHHFQYVCTLAYHERRCILSKHRLQYLSTLAVADSCSWALHALVQQLDVAMPLHCLQPLLLRSDAAADTDHCNVTVRCCSQVYLLSDASMCHMIRYQPALATELQVLQLCCTYAHSP